MTRKTFLLIITLLCFLFLGGSGLLLYFAFDGDVFRKFLGLNKAEWLNYHMIAAVFNVLLISYHVGSRWSWVEHYILAFQKTKVSSDIRKRQFSNLSMMVVFSISLLSAFLAYLMSGECDVCLEIHKNTGLVFWVAFLYHLFLHRKSFFNRR